MRAALRSIVAVLAGFVAAFAVITLVEVVNSAVFFEFPDGVDPMNHEAVTAYLAEHGIPTAALVVILVGYLLGSALGGAVTAMLARHAPLLHAGVVAALLEVGGILNLQRLPHPQWFVIVSLLIFFPVALLSAAAVRGLLRRA